MEAELWRRRHTAELISVTIVETAKTEEKPVNLLTDQRVWNLYKETAQKHNFIPADIPVEMFWLFWETYVVQSKDGQRHMIQLLGHEKHHVWRDLICTIIRKSLEKE